MTLGRTADVRGLRWLVKGWFDLARARFNVLIDAVEPGVGQRTEGPKSTDMTSQTPEAGTSGQAALKRLSGDGTQPSFAGGDCCQTSCDASTNQKRFPRLHAPFHVLDRHQLLLQDSVLVAPPRVLRD